MTATLFTFARTRERAALFFILCLTATLAVAGSGCRKEVPERGAPVRDINEVKERHVAELMAIKGVTGVYVGRTDDGIPCIRVMVVERTKEIEERIPKELEGHPVEIEAGGPIRPMHQ